VDDTMLDARLSREGPTERRELDEVGTGADHGEDASRLIHGIHVVIDARLA
jgi:hypothetical protein